MATELQIYNMALRMVGAARVTQANLDDEDVEQARILNDVGDLVRDAVLAEHPWNFAIKRAKLTALGGVITTWTAQGTANVWQATLTTEPADVKFDGTEGTEQTSIAACTAEGYWYWESNILYVYSASDPDSAYDEINAVIPEFDWDYAFSLPSDCLRIIKVEDNAEFVKEEDRLLSDESEITIQYIAKITDTTKYSAAFIIAYSARLAFEITFPLSNDPTLPNTMYKIYLEKLRIAKGIDAQEGTGQEQKDLNWESARE